jgi:alkanesulfonate monooxygenase SsuD/methylene tetrahydromethanopterin reductase-like flavin-dependent oxidoreductase (luciferase family)
MEFGIFLQGHVPARRVEEDPTYEHYALMREVEIAKAADTAGFKYVWASEHHFLHEYSHLSDSGAFLAFVAGQTERIHMATGIRNLSPRVNHPIRVAEEVAMMDHLTGGRFELGTGRGAGWHEVQGFDIPDTKVTKGWWDEVIRQLPRMWREVEYEFEGEFFRVPGKRMILPKPFKKSHPPLWVSAGNPQTWEIAGQMGLGCIGFSIGSIDSMGPKVEAYKKAIVDADPIGEWVHDNVMATNLAIVTEDGAQARQVATQAGTIALQAGVHRYHSTMPKVPGIPEWPEIFPDPNLDAIEAGIKGGFMVCGDPDEAVEQLKRFEATGIDQITFSLPVDIPQEVCLETVRLLGEHVIPKFDTDPEFRSAKQRAAADVPEWADQAVPRTTGPGPEPSSEGTRPLT